jgi:molybdate transport system permease protein
LESLRSCLDEQALRGESGAAVRAPRPTLPQLDSRLLVATPAALLVAFIVIPIAALVLRAATSPSFLASVSGPLVLDALRLTIATTALSFCAIVLTGTPLAYVLARWTFPGKRMLDTVVDFPLVLPPVVAGVSLLMAFGRRGLLGQQLEMLGIEIPFTAAAVVLAQTFVAAPFFIHGARVGFRSVDPAIEEAASIDGASVWARFRQVTLPLAMPGLVSGSVLAVGRSISEFGATLLFAGNLEGRTQTMSLAIMQAMQTDLTSAIALAVLLVASSGTVLLVSRTLIGDRMEF